MMTARVLIAGLVGSGLLAGCDSLTVPAPTGVVPGGTARGSQTGAEAVFNGAKIQVFEGLSAAGELMQWSSLLTDESTWTEFSFFPASGNIDARMTTGGGSVPESGDEALGFLLPGRSSLLLAVGALRHAEPPGSGRARIGEAMALAGYVELFLAEDYCAGVTLDQVSASGGPEYGTPLTTDSLLATAAAHFDSAAANANGSDSVAFLAGVGLGRALVDRGQYQAAAAAVVGVPTSYVYNTELAPNQSTGPYINLYSSAALSCSPFNTSDREAGIGLDFVSAHDPRLVLDSTFVPTCDGQFYPPGPWYYPVKFGLPPSGLIPLATGVEARLIEAEAALQAGQIGTWTSVLNALRADSADTHIAGLFPLSADSTTTAATAMQVSIMFRERAFWLYGTGTRLGDLRRLIRQYGRDQSTVFPSGPYRSTTAVPAPYAEYGPDVNLTLPTAGSGHAVTNPYYQGCLDRKA